MLQAHMIPKASAGLTASATLAGLTASATLACSMKLQCRDAEMDKTSRAFEYIDLTTWRGASLLVPILKVSCCLEKKEKETGLSVCVKEFNLIPLSIRCAPVRSLGNVPKNHAILRSGYVE